MLLAKCHHLSLLFETTGFFFVHKRSLYMSSQKNINIADSKFKFFFFSSGWFFTICCGYIVLSSLPRTAIVLDFILTFILFCTHRETRNLRFPFCARGTGSQHRMSFIRLSENPCRSYDMLFLSFSSS